MHDKKINTIHVSSLVLQRAALLYFAGQLTAGACRAPAPQRAALWCSMVDLRVLLNAQTPSAMTSPCLGRANLR